MMKLSNPLNLEKNIFTKGMPEALIVAFLIGKMRGSTIVSL
jgi:hypothetical protein